MLALVRRRLHPAYFSCSGPLPLQSTDMPHVSRDRTEHFAPDDRSQRHKWWNPGANTAVVLWLLVSLCFRLYLHFFNSYSVTYGSLGALIILMLWFYFTGLAILIGGEINSELEHKSR